ncbi:MAG: ankyrin repeat domain-containing protein [Vulcanimicrobiota bacterium]
MLVKHPGLINETDVIDDAIFRRVPRDVWRFFDTLNSLAGIIKEGESQKGNTLLHVAVKKRDDDMIRLLIRKGADVNAKNMNGNTALHYAADTGTAMILIKSGAHIDAKNKRGDTLLHKSAYNGMEDMVRVLLLNGADSNAVNDKGMTPLHSASMGGSALMIERMVKNGANVNSLDLRGRTPMHYAVGNCKSILFETFLAFDAIETKSSFNDKRSYDGITPLHEAAYCGRDEVLEYLLERGGDVNARSLHGLTPLHYAAGADCGDEMDLFGHIKRSGGERTGKAELLLIFGAQPDAKDDRGLTPLDWALRKKNYRMAELIKKHSETKLTTPAENPEPGAVSHCVSAAKNLRDAMPPALDPWRNIWSAKSHYAEALKVAPRHVPALTGMGDCYFRMGEYELAKRFYERACMLAPEDKKAWQGVGAVKRNDAMVFEIRPFLKDGESVLSLSAFSIRSIPYIAVLAARKKARGSVTLLRELH